MENADIKLGLFQANAGLVIVFSYLTLLMKNRGITEEQIGWITIPFALSLILSNAFFGRLSDLRGKRAFLLGGISLSMISSFLYIFPATAGGFLIVRILNGITLGIYQPALIGIASDRHAKLGNLSSFGSLGWAFGGLLGGFIADLLNLEIIFALGSLMFAVSFTILFFAKTGTESSVEIKEHTNSKKGNYFEVIKRNWQVYLLVIARHSTANAIWLYWILFITLDLGFSTTQYGMIQATNMLTQFIFMKTIGDKFNSKLMLFVGGIFSAVAFYSFTIVTSFYLFVGTQVILGFSWALFYVGGIRTVESASIQIDSVSTGTGLFNSSLSTAQVIGPIIAITLFRLAHVYTLSMQVAAIVTLVATALYFVLKDYHEITFADPISLPN